MKKLTLIVMAAMTLALTACNSGNGGYSHATLVDDFVYRLNLALGYDVDIQKTYTQQSGYVVVYDYDYGTYDAYYVGDYLPSDDIGDYVSYYNSNFFYDLDYIGGNDYQDPFSGIIFNQGQNFQRNGLKAEGSKNKLIAEKVTDRLVASTGMSHDGASKIVQTSMMVQAMNKHGAGEAAYSNMVQNVTGSSSVEWGSAYLTGSESHQKQLIEKAASRNNMSASDINLFLDAFMK